MIGDQTDKPVVVALGAAGFDDIPGLAGLADAAGFRFVSESGKLSDALAGADVLLGWDFQADALAASWPAADRVALDPLGRCRCRRPAVSGTPGEPGHPDQLARHLRRSHG